MSAALTNTGHPEAMEPHLAMVVPPMCAIASTTSGEIAANWDITATATNGQARTASLDLCLGFKAKQLEHGHLLI